MNTVLRCEECGRIRVSETPYDPRRRQENVRAWPCPDHPAAAVVPWGRLEHTAYRYVCAYAKLGREVGLSDTDLYENVANFPAMVEEQRERAIDRWTGVQRETLVVACALWRRWGDVLPEDREREALPPGGPGIFGRKSTASEIEAYQARVRAARNEGVQP